MLLLEILIVRNTTVGVLFLIRIAWSYRLFIKKEALAQVFSWEYWETPILKTAGKASSK